jgi:CRP-like cAMP-binding protein
MFCNLDVPLRMPNAGCDLNTCFLCQNCLPEWKDVIAVKKTTILFKKGKKIFTEGEEVKGIYFIYEGFAKIFMQWGGEKELILRFAKAGDILGHRGFGGDHHYPISASALDDIRVCFIPDKFLSATLKTNTGFTNKLLEVFATDLQKAEKRMRDLAHMEVKGRIALALLEISKKFGTDKEKFISVPLLRQDIASYAGTTYETVFKYFVELTQKKILTTSGKQIRINNAEALRKMISYQ